jgi:hypothetical protein
VGNENQRWFLLRRLDSAFAVTAGSYNMPDGGPPMVPQGAAARRAAAGHETGIPIAGNADAEIIDAGRQCLAARGLRAG